MDIKITIIFLLAILSFQFSFAEDPPQMRFEHLLEQGSKESVKLGGASTIYQIIQDNDGFMWFLELSNKRLLRYDGHTFKPFNIGSELERQKKSYVLTSVIVDKQGQLWVGTSNGLFLYEKEQEKFVPLLLKGSFPNFFNQRYITSMGMDNDGNLLIGSNMGLSIFDPMKYQLKSNHPNFLNDGKNSNLIIESLMTAKDGSIWLSGEDSGLIHFDPQTSLYEHWESNPEDPTTLLSNNITRIIQDHKDRIWIASIRFGVSRLERNGQFIHYLNTPLPNNQKYDIQDLLIDSNQRIWAALDKGGLAYYDETADKFQRLTAKPGDDSSIRSNVVRALYEDRQKNLWLSMFPSGIDFYNASSSVFTTIRHDPFDSKSISDSNIICVYQDSSGAIWICTANGLNRYDRDHNTFKSYQIKEYAKLGLGSDTIMGINEDKNGNFWIPTWGGGLHNFDFSEESFRRYLPNKSKTNQLSSSHVWTSLLDSQGRLWVGTFEGLNLYNSETDSFIHYKYSPKDISSISSNYIFSLLEKDENNLWVGLIDGLNLLNIETGKFQKIHFLNNFECHVLYLDSENNLWIGTDSGVFIYDVSAEKGIEHLTVKNGLPSNVIRMIIEDDIGNVWLGSNNGLVRYHRKTGKMTTFLKSDGLAGNNYDHDAAFKDENGVLLLGSTEGLTIFNPSDLVSKSNNSEIVFTGFRIHNKEVKPSKQSPLKKSINVTDEVILDHTHTMFTFEFSILSYASSYLNEYAYMLEGFDNDWRHVGNQNTATYTSIPPGEYTFRVRAKDGKGNWSSRQASVKLAVLPPPWATWWAYSIYFLIVSMAIWALINYENRKYALKKERQLNQNLIILDKTKDSFLSNTSHELRTPINGVVGIAESLIEGAEGPLPDTVKENLAMIVDSGNRLSRLVNNILDFSKIKNEGIELHHVSIDLKSIVKKVLDLSIHDISGKPIKLVNNIQSNLPMVWADEDRLLQILHNLIGNAIKFTKEGCVTVDAEESNGVITINVHDTGIGIPEDKLEYVFDSFSQVDNSASRHYGGTGLGLAVTKELVLLHDGEIHISSTINKGSTLSFTLPISQISKKQNYYLNNKRKLGTYFLDKSRVAKIKPAHITNEDETREKVKKNLINETDISFTNKYLNYRKESFHILIVDDDSINRRVLRNYLSLLNCRVSESISGQDALDTLSNPNHEVDLVLLDIMMPILSGYDVCKEVRKNYTTSQLPIIFLTAKNLVDDLSLAYQVGGNDYLTKPLAKEELFARVDTQIQLLKINRRLETMIEERTEQVFQKHKELQLTHNKLEKSHIELKQAQSQLVQAEKMSALGTLVAGVGHELNNPITYTHMAANNLEYELGKLKKELDQQDSAIIPLYEAREHTIMSFLNTIQEGAHRVTEIVTNLQTFSRLEKSDMYPARLREGLESTLQLVIPNYESNIDFICELKANPKVKCLPSEINQVFMNLILNACQACVKRQEQSAEQKQSKLIISMLTDNDMLRIEFRDTGIGITDEDKGKIFDPFFTTREDGTGLGLAISYGIVKRHHGVFDVSSTVGEGSCFTLSLPVCHEESQLQAESSLYST